MSEVAFSKQFLAALDARAIKLSSDHIADARQYPEGAIFVLPRLPHPPHPQRPNPPSSTAPSTSAPSDPSSANTTTEASSSAEAQTLSITLKPLKPAHPPLSLSQVSAKQTSIYDLKAQYAVHASIPESKIKVLYRKKPVADSKTVGEVVGDDGKAGQEVEFGVMVMGGAGGAAATPVGTPPATPAGVASTETEKGLAGQEQEQKAVPAAQGVSGKEVVMQDAFWEDLRGFVVQRIRDEKEGERLVGVFKGAWEESR